MIVLAMDTAGSACAACVYDSGADRILAQRTETLGRGHAERLMAIITDALQAADVRYADLNRIVTTIGPGSFTGIRVGVATARGFAIGLNVDVAGVNSLEAILVDALTAEERSKGTNAVAVNRSGRDNLYFQANFATTLGAANTPVHTTPSEVSSVLGRHGRPLILTGDGTDLLLQVEDLVQCDVRNTTGIAAIETIARIGAEKPVGDERPEPLYLRKPDAKPKQGFAVERLP